MGDSFGGSYDLSKALVVIVLPIAIVSFLVLLGALRRNRAWCFTGVVVLWLSASPYVGYHAIRAAEDWQTPVSVKAVPRAFAIVVLSGMLVDPPGEGGTTEWGDAVDRFEAGIHLFEEGKAQWLVFTGGVLPPPFFPRTEGDLLAEQAVRRGIPRTQIAVTGAVSDTAGEAQAVALMMGRLHADNRASTVILVTSAFHMRRSRLLFAQTGIPVLPFPVDFQGSAHKQWIVHDFVPSANGLRLTELAMREGCGFAFYSLARSVQESKTGRLAVQ